MMLKTLAILLSLGTAYSTATHAMNPDQDGFSAASQRKLRAAEEELSKISQSIRAGDEAFSKRLQTTPGEKAAAIAALQQVKNKQDAEDKKLSEAIFRYIDALDDLTMSAEESARGMRELEELKQNFITAKEALFAEYDETYGHVYPR